MASASRCFSFRKVLSHVSALFLIGLPACIALTGCGVEAPSGHLQGETSGTFRGTIHGGQQPVGASTLQLYAVGTTGDGSAATPLLSGQVTTSDGTGNATNSNANASNGFNSLPVGGFSIAVPYTCPSPSTQVYLAATGGNPGLSAGTNNPALAMLAFLGRCGDIGPSTNVSMNELTTIGSLAPIAPYIHNVSAIGSGSSDASAFLTALNLVRSYTDTANGIVPGPDLAPNYDPSVLNVTTLADIIAGCVNSTGVAGPCQQLFTLATPPGGNPPTELVEAVADILQNPTNNTAAIYNLLPPNSPFQPTASSSPSAWTLPILPIAALPVISPGSATFSTAPTITISDATPGATVYYTVDGSAPTTSSPIYAGPFTLPPSAANTRSVRAFAVVSGYSSSAVATAIYTIPVAGSTKTVSFLTQPADGVISQPLNTVRVGFVDAYGTIVPSNNTFFTLALSSNPAGATLSGTLTVSTGSAGDGTAYFTGLSLNKVATGYTLLASTSGKPSATSNTFAIKPPPIVFTLPGALIGTGRTLPGTLTLPSAAPAGGVVVNLSSSDPTVVSMAPATVTIAAGSTTGTFTYTATGSGPATFTATATGYPDGTATVTTTANFLSLGTFPTAPNGSPVAVSVTASTPATATTSVVLSSSNTAVGTISTPATIASGATTPASQPQFTPRSYGLTTVTATAAGYAPDSRVVTIAGSATLTQNLTVPRSSATSVTLTLAAASTATTVFTLSSDNTSVATVPASVFVNPGATTTTFNVTGVGAGFTTIHAISPGFSDATSTVVTTSYISGVTGTPVLGLVTAASVTLGTAAVTPVSLTITSGTPANVLLSTTPGGAGSASITLSNVTGTTATFYEIGVASGSSLLTLSSAAYTTTTSTATTKFPMVSFQVPGIIDPSTLLTGPQTFYVSLGYNNAGTFVPCFNVTTQASNCQLPAGQTVTTTFASSNTSVGTFDKSAITFNSSTSNVAVVFTPVGNGITYANLGTMPAGYTSPGAESFTVNTPTFTVPATNVTTSPGVTTARTGQALSQTDTRAGGATVTVSVGNGSLATLSTDPNVIGTSTLTLTGITSALPTIYIQGAAAGQTPLTYSSPGYTTVTKTLFVANAQVQMTASASTVTTVSPNATVNVILNSGGVACTPATCFLNPGQPQTVTFASSNGPVGAVTGSVTIPALASTASGTFTGTAAGSTVISLNTPPAPLTLAGTSTSATISVTQSTVTAAAVQTGTSLQIGATATVSEAVPANGNVTVTSNNPAVAVVSTSSSAAGSASVAGPATANHLTYYVQGLSAGTTTLTISAPGGFQSATVPITVLPGGLAFDSTKPGTFTTNAFAAANTIGVYLVELNATTGAIVQTCNGLPNSCALSPGAGFSTMLVSSNSTVGSVTGNALTFAPGGYTATTAFTPNDVGTAALTFSTQPANFGAAATGKATVTGYDFASANVTIAAGTYASFDTSLNTTPPVPVNVTLTVLDTTMARLSTDKTVLGTGGTVTYNNVSCLTSFCSTGGAPFTYVQGIAPGFTKIRLTARGYNPATVTVVVDKLGETLPAASYITAVIGASGTFQIGSRLSYLDPYSASVVSDCTASSCLLNPGVTPTVSVVPDDPTVLSFGPAGAYDPSTSLMFIPVTPVSPGQTNYSLGAAPAGFTNTTTPGRRAGQGSATVSGAAGLQNSLYIVSSDLDAGIGVEVQSGFNLSGTVFGYDSTLMTVTVSDPTIAVVSGSPTTAGLGVITLNAGVAYAGFPFYVQGLKAGTVTLTLTKTGYLSRTVTVNVRPAGFVIKAFDFTGPGANRSTSVTAYPAILNAAGQWMANAQLNPGSGAVTVPVSSSNPAIGTSGSATFASNAASGTITVQGVALGGSTTFTLGTPPPPFIAAATYQSIAMTQ